MRPVCPATFSTAGIEEGQRALTSGMTKNLGIVTPAQIAQLCIQHCQRRLSAVAEHWADQAGPRTRRQYGALAELRPTMVLTPQTRHRP